MRLRYNKNGELVQYSRMVTITGSIQILMVVSGIVCQGIYMKMNGWPDMNYLRWSEFALFLRHHGIWLMVLPLLWTALAIKFRDNHDMKRIVLFSGIILCAAIFLMFFIAAKDHIHPFIIAL